MQPKSAADTIHSLLAATPISNIMSSDVLTVYEGWSIRRLSQFFLKHHISGAPVIAADDELVGVVTQTDVLRFDSQKPDERAVQRVVEHYCGPIQREIGAEEMHKIQDKALDYMTVNSIMTEAVITIELKENLATAYQLINENNIHRLFVIDDGILVGVVTAMDILRHIGDA